MPRGGRGKSKGGGKAGKPGGSSFGGNAASKSLNNDPMFVWGGVLDGGVVWPIAEPVNRGRPPGVGPSPAEVYDEQFILPIWQPGDATTITNNTYYSTSGSWTVAPADSKTFSFVARFKMSGIPATSKYLFAGGESSTEYFSVYLNSLGEIEVIGKNTAGTTILDVTLDDVNYGNGTEYTVAINGDMDGGDTDNLEIKVNGSDVKSAITITTFSDGTLGTGFAAASAWEQLYPGNQYFWNEVLLGDGTAVIGFSTGNNLNTSVILSTSGYLTSPGPDGTNWWGEQPEFLLITPWCNLGSTEHATDWTQGDRNWTASVFEPLVNEGIGAGD